MLDSPRRYYLAGLILLATLTGHSQPANDNFTNSIPLTSTPALFEGSIRNATAEPGEPPGGFPTSPPRNSLWWNWTAPAKVYAEVSLSTSNFAPVVKVYTGDHLTNLIFLTAGTCCNNARYVGWFTTVGQRYEIAVDSYNGVGEFTGALTVQPRPPNDDFEDRILLPPMTNVVTASNTVWGTSASGSNQYASAEPGEPALDPLGSRPAGKSLWWSWIAPVSGLASVRITSTNFPLATKVLIGNSITNLTSAGAASNIGSSHDVTYILQVREGDRYEIIVDSWQNFGLGEVVVSITEIPAPLNDDFTNRFLLTDNRFALTGRLEAASTEAGEPFHGFPGPTRQSIWWEWTPAVSGNVTVTVGSLSVPIPNPPRFAIYTGMSLAGLAMVTNGGSSLPSQVTFHASAGVQYQIAVASLNTAARQFSLSLQEGALPTISWITPTTDIAVPRGADIPFEVSASDPDGPIARVEIYGAGQSSVPLVAPPYTFTITNIGYGTHRIGARVTDLDGLQTFITRIVDVPQANDSFADRWSIVGFPVTVQGTNAGATTEPGEPLHANSTGFGSVWWTWTPTQSGPVVIAARMGNPAGTSILAVYTGSALDSLSEVASRRGSSSGNNAVVIDAIAGTPYQIAVDSTGLDGFTFSLAILPLPPNDHFTNRIHVTGDSFAVSGYNYGASAEPGEPTTTAQTNRSVWWSWTAPYSQRVTLTQSNNFRSEIYVYTGAALSSLTEIARGTFCCGGGPSMGFDAVQGVEYQIAVNNWFTEFAGDIAFNVRPAAVPSLTKPAIANGQLSLVLAGIPGRSHRLESSTNLLDWFSVQTVTLTTNTFPFSTSLTAGPGSTFFRAVLLP